MSISIAVATLRPTIERLAEFAALGRDWDSYGGFPTSPRAVSQATELLVLLADRLPALDPERLIPYAIAPIADGGVQLEWRGRGREIEVEISPAGKLGYLLVDGQGDARRFDEQREVSLEQSLAVIAAILEW